MYCFVFFVKRVYFLLLFICRCILAVQEALHILLQKINQSKSEITSIVRQLAEPSLTSPNLNINQTLDFWLKNSSKWPDQSFKYKILKSVLLLIAQTRRTSPNIYIDAGRMKTFANQIIFLWKFHESVKEQNQKEADSLFKVIF